MDQSLFFGDGPECAEWQGDRQWPSESSDGGYGKFTLNNHPERAHRVAYELFVGLIPEGLEICHTCDNPPVLQAPSDRVSCPSSAHIV